MIDYKTLMKVESTLPEGFDGTFTFTNWSDEDFTGIYDKKEYTFPARTTSKMVMADFSPRQIQNIRKRFAQDLGEREFFKGQDYENLRAPEGTIGNRPFSSMNQGRAYTLDMLVPYIQKALEPLDEGRVRVQEQVGDALKESLRRDDKGRLVSASVGENDEDGLRELAVGSPE